MQDVKRERSIVLDLTLPPPPQNLDTSATFGIGDLWLLEQWLNRLKSPTKKGTRLNVRYVATGDFYELQWWRFGLRSLRDRFKHARAEEALEGMEVAISRAIDLIEM